MNPIHLKRCAFVCVCVLLLTVRSHVGDVHVWNSGVDLGHMVKVLLVIHKANN